MNDTIDVALRENNILGDPGSGKYKPLKAPLRRILKRMESVSAAGVVHKGTVALLNAITPPTENYGGMVYADPTPANNGFYVRVAAAWSKVRGLPDTFAQLHYVTGSGNAFTVVADTPINPADIGLYLYTPDANNTGAVVVTISGYATKPLLAFDGSGLAKDYLQAGAPILFYDAGPAFRLFLDHRFQLLAAQAAQSAANAEVSRLAALLAEMGSEGARDAAVTARLASEQARDVGLFASDLAVAAAEASGPAEFFDTKAEAEAALGSLPDGQIVEITVDESRYNATSRYVVESGDLAFKTLIRNYLPEIALEEFGDPQADFSGCMTAAIAAANARNGVVVLRPTTYRASTPMVLTDQHFRVRRNGALILRATDAPDAPVFHLKYSFGVPEAVTGQQADKIWAGYPTKEITTSGNFVDGTTLILVQKTYTWRTALTGGVGVANEILIGGSASASLDNLVSAFMATPADAGVKYGTGTVASTRATAKKMSSSKVAIISRVRCVTQSKWNDGGTVANVTVAEAHSLTDVWRFEISSGSMAALAPVAGDVLKAFSKDLITHSRTGDNERRADIFEVAVVDGNYIYSLRPLRVTLGSDLVTSAPRLSKMTRREVDFDLRIEDEPGSPVTRGTDLMIITGAIGAEIRGECRYALGGFIRLVSPFRARSNLVTISDLRTSIAGYYNSYGYGISEYGGVDSHHSGLYGARCRHPWTDGALTTAEDSNDPATFGGCLGTVLDDLHAIECENSGVDTHPSSRLVVFNNPVVMMSHQGAEAGIHAAQLRGDRCAINDLVGYGLGAFRIKTYGDGTGNFVSVKQFIRLSGYTTVSPAIFLDGTEATPGFKPKHSISGRLVVDSYANNLMSQEACDIDMQSFAFDFQNTGAANGSCILVTNGTLTYDLLNINLTRSSAIQARIFKTGDAAAVIKGRHIEVESVLTWVVADLAGFNATVVCPSIHANVAPSSLANGGFVNVGAGAVAWAGITIDRALTAGPRILAFTHSNGADKTLSFPGRGNNVLRGVITTSAACNVTVISPPVHTDQVLELYGDPTSTQVTRIPTSCTGILTTSEIYIRPGRLTRLFSAGGVWVLDRPTIRAGESRFYGDAGINLTAADAGAFAKHVWNTPLTAGRAITLPSEDCGPIEIIRGLACTGNFILTIGPSSIWALRMPGSRALFAWDGTAYAIASASSMSGVRVRGNADTTMGASDMENTIYNSVLSTTRSHILNATGPARQKIGRTAAATGSTLTIYQPDGTTSLTTLAAGFTIDVDRDGAGLYWVVARSPLS